MYKKLFLSIRAQMHILLLLSVICLPFAHIKWNIVGIPVYSIEIPIILACISYVVGCWSREFTRVQFSQYPRPFTLTLILFLTGTLLSFFLNPFTLTGLGMLKTWFVMPLLWMWLWHQTQPTVQHYQNIFGVWLAVNSVSAIFSLIFFVQGTLTYDNRLAGWYTSPNYLAFFLAPGILLALHFFFSFSQSHQKYSRIGISFLLSVFSIAIFLTHSYTAWGALFVSVLAFLLMTYRKSFFGKQGILSLMVVLVIAIGLIFFEIDSEKWQSLTQYNTHSSMASRIIIWNVSLYMIADQPIFGIGLGRFQEMYLLYQPHFPPYLEWAVPQPHNLFLALWLQTSIIGMVSFLLLGMFWFWYMFRCRHQCDDVIVRQISTTLIALLTFFFFLGFTDTPFFKTDSAFTFWIIVGLGMTLCTQILSVDPLQRNKKNDTKTPQRF